MSLAGTLGGNTSDQARPFEKGAGFFVPLEPNPPKCKKGIQGKKSTKKEKRKMTVFDELKARGLLAQLTDEEEIKELINNGKATFYIGFDPTADSLHVGHFMALCLMKRMQMAGNKPIALIGGGTAMIGDPSGRTDMRTMMTKGDDPA